MKENPNNNLPFLQGGGEMGVLIRSFDWLNTPLGVPATWTAGLKVAVGIMLSSNFATLICWGADYTQLYNDKFRPINGKTKHPSALGHSACDTYAEIWDTIKPMFEDVMAGKTHGFPDFMVQLDRNGYVEDCYFDFSYSPIKEEDGSIGGIIVVCNETTEKVKAIDELNVYQKNIRNMIRQAPVGMCIISGQPLMVDEMNDLFLESVGKTRAQFERKPYWEVVSEAREMYEPIVRRVFETGETYYAREDEIQLIRKGKVETAFVDFVYEPMRDVDGVVNAIMIVVNDVTDKITSRKSLEDNNEAMYAINEEMTASNEELTATNEELNSTQTRLHTLFGELEISEKKYRNEQRQLERFFMQAPAGICILDGPDLIFELINPLYQQLFPGRKLMGKPLLEAVPEIKGVPIWDVLMGVYDTGKSFEGKELLIPLAREDNSLVEDRYFNFIYQARLNEENKVDGILVFVLEVTQGVLSRQEIEKSRTALQQVNEEITASRQMLQRTEQMLRFAIDAANIGTYILDSKTRTLIVSPRLKELFGFYPDEDMPYEAAMSNITDEFRQRVMDGVEAAFKEGKDFNMDYRIRGFHDHQLRWLRAVGKVDASTYAGETIFSGAVIDITQQKAEEAQLAENAEKHARLAAIVNSSDDTILSKTLQGMITSWNASAERMFGYTAEETLGKHISLIIPADRLSEEEFIIGQIRQGLKVDHFETVRVAKDGRLIPISLTVSPITDEAGHIIGASKIARDISAQKEAQETASRLYEQVRILNDKKDEFIGLASHELKTPLTSINGYLQILSRTVTDPNSKRFVERTGLQLKKLTALVNDLLDVSKIEAGKLQFNMEIFDLKLLVEDAIELIQHSTNKYVINFDAKSDQCIITADSTRIEQVLINLLTNAIKYSPGADQVDVSINCTETTATISIKDYGLGIAADKLSQIFSRFYRIDDAPANISGLGIGLYLSKEIISRHNGELWVESEPGKGSTFFFTLPINSI